MRTQRFVCVWVQAVEGGNRAAGGGMGAGISLPDRPPGPPVEGRSCLAAPLWSPLCACCHVSPCPRGCVPHCCLHFSCALRPFPCPLPLPLLSLCPLFCLSPFFVLAPLCCCPFFCLLPVFAFALLLPLPFFALALCSSASSFLCLHLFFCLSWFCQPLVAY